jgi:HEAT repeat protein
MPRSPIHRATFRRIRRALASDEPALRADAIDALGILGDVGGLVDALAHDDAYVRRAAVRGLAGRPGERLTWRLAQTRFDPDEDVRCAVADALAGRTGWLGAHALRRIVEQDESASVRYRALVGLATSDSAKVEDVLRAALAGDPEQLVRETARTLLAERGVVVGEEDGAGAVDTPGGEVEDDAGAVDAPGGEQEGGS